MSVSVFIRTKHGMRRWEPGKRWLSLPLFIAAIGATWWHGQLQNSAQQQLQVSQANELLQQQQQQFSQLRDQTDVQLSLLASKVGRIQARMNRVEAVAATMAAQADLSEQFDFESEVGLGGVASPSQQEIDLSLLIEQMDQLVKRLDRADNQLPLLESLDRNHHIDLDRYLSGRPLVNGWQSSSYGYRNDPFTGRRAKHRGLDFAGSEGGEVIATGAGVISYSGKLSGYGNLVEIDHGNGLKTRYGHNKENLVELGQLVKKGELIALIGNTGRSTGPHVHYEVLQNDKQVDPARYVYRQPRSE
ncbi:M23 family metallopeptidase [Ferrimonas lipolytica]|uniref:M23 family metallopeptidase n=1 Tax=Ferrimonas lipolytica TaxID=2724191 RepID=A0A6H1UIV2_9GAMM|nr:M23 family metallopeptidase [Ferrimonas lipolytica]QIZ78540.1 M23 family metallopeptidase [Ferrimonas lipolytica]